MFLVVGCNPSEKTEPTNPDVPTFTGVAVALGVKKDEAEGKFQNPQQTNVPNGNITLSSSGRIMQLSTTLSTVSSNPFDGTVIDNVYVYTKGNTEYLVIDIDQPDTFNKVLFDLVAVSSNEWDSPRFYASSLTGNIFRHSDDLNQLFLPISVSGPVSSTQTFKVEYIRYNSGAGTQEVYFPEDVEDTISILVAGNTIDFEFEHNPFMVKGLYNSANQTISLNLKNNDSLPLSEVYINNQLAYDSEQLLSYSKHGVITLPIPEDLVITTYNWVKIKVTYSILDYEAIPSEETLISEVFLATDFDIIYDYNGDLKTLDNPFDLLILNPEDLVVFGSDLFDTVNLLFVSNLDLTSEEFLEVFVPLNIGRVFISSLMNNNLSWLQQELYIIEVVENFVFINSLQVREYDYGVFINRVGFSHTVLVGSETERVYSITEYYEAHEREYFGSSNIKLKVSE
jgi:hypothetical protein